MPSSSRRPRLPRAGGADLHRAQAAAVRAAERRQFPGTIPDVTSRLIKAGAAQTERLYGWDYKVGDRFVSSNEISEVLAGSRDLDERLAYWEASKEIGAELRGGLLDLRNLRNEAAASMGFSSFFALEVSEYDMTPEEMMTLMDELIDGIRPSTNSCTAGPSTSWPRATASRCRAAFPPTGSATSGPRPGRASSRASTWTPWWPTGATNGCCSRPSATTRAWASPPCPLRSGRRAISTPCPRRHTQEEHPRQRLAHRSRPGRPLPDERHPDLRLAARPRTTSWATSTTT